ncbi:hypothetical protein R3I93_022702 [Phoxinus phoxinus]|uniref:Uncharacterized protein n=1 Tax=Phoxinus phoxinus TaxID=58324 RepID=A0AAN9C4L3_9TELE
MTPEENMVLDQGYCSLVYIQIRWWTCT